MSAANPSSDQPAQPGETPPGVTPASEAASSAAQPGEARSSAIMAAGTLVSRMLGFGKTWMLGAALGLGSTVNDTFINANNLPNLIFLLVAGGVFNAVLVPQIIKASKAPDRGADYISRLLTLAVLVLLSLTLLVTLLAPAVIELTTQGYSPQQKSLAVTFAFWCLPQIFFYGLYALLTQVLNANGAFGPAMWAPILNNIVAIAGLGMFIWIFGANVANPHSLDNWGDVPDVLRRRFLHHRRRRPDGHPADPRVPAEAGTAPALRLARCGTRPRRKAERLDAPDCRRRAVGVPVCHAHRHHSRCRAAPPARRPATSAPRPCCPATPCSRWPASCTCCRTRSSRSPWPPCCSTG